MTDRIVRQHRFTVTPEHLILDPRVDDRAVRLWLRLDRYAGDKGGAFPSRTTLGIEVDASKASVDRSITQLVDAGWLKKSQRQAGGTNLYVLTEAPEKLVRKLVKETRAARWAAEAERRANSKKTKAEKDAAKAAVEAERREAEAGEVDADEQDAIDALEPASAQVSEGGVITSEDTPNNVQPSRESEGGVITHDDTPSSPVTTGVITHDAQKEATRSENQGRSSDPSLRSGSAGGQQALLPEDDTPSLVPVAQQIVKDFQSWYETATQKPIPSTKKSRGFMALWKQYVLPELEAGRTRDQIVRALSKCGSAWPTPETFERQMILAMGGTPLLRPESRPQRAGTHFAVETEQERHQAEAAAAFQ